VGLTVQVPFRHVDVDGGSFAGLAEDLDRAVMQLNQPLGQRQAEADTVVFAIKAAIDLPERRRAIGICSRGHADPGIEDAKTHTGPGCA
jgi:hypothetical protein